MDGPLNEQNAVILVSEELEPDDAFDLDEEAEIEPEIIPEDPQGRISETKIDLEKVADYFRTKTVQVADALERLISELRPSWGHQRLAPFVAVLDEAREHVAGYHKPMVWQTEFEARRYALAHNRHAEPNKRAKVVPAPEGVLVITPK